MSSLEDDASDARRCASCARVQCENLHSGYQPSSLTINTITICCLHATFSHCWCCVIVTPTHFDFFPLSRQQNQQLYQQQQQQHAIHQQNRNSHHHRIPSAATSHSRDNVCGETSCCRGDLHHRGSTLTFSC